MKKPLKKHLSVEQQVELLSSRGLIISDRENAAAFLSNVNYYRFTGYLHGFKCAPDGHYAEGTTFEQIVALYNFDRRLTRVLMFALEDIEETLKTRMSYMLTSAFPDDPLIYLDASLYRDSDTYNKFCEYFSHEVSNNRNLPFIKHYNTNYDGQLPMWVAVEIMTMGNLHALYTNFLPRYQKTLARTYATGVVQLESWIKNLTFTRNHLAHYMRVYDFNFGRTPAQCDVHHQYKTTTGRIFDQVYVMSFMYSDSREWNNYVLPELDEVLAAYRDVVQLSAIGFPQNWRQILTVKQ